MNARWRGELHILRDLDSSSTAYVADKNSVAPVRRGSMGDRLRAALSSGKSDKDVNLA